MEWFAEPPQDFRDLMDELGFGPWDRPSEVFGDSVVMIDNDELTDNQKAVGKISSWVTLISATMMKMPIPIGKLNAQRSRK